jgi:phage protein D
MDFTDLQAAYGGFYTPRFEIRVGQANPETFTEADGRVSGLSVETALDRLNRVSFTLNGVFDPENRQFVAEYTETFEEGRLLEVRLGYGDTRKLVFRGRIDTLRPEFPESSGPRVSVAGHDLLDGLTDGTGRGSWSETTLDTVVSDLVGGLDFRGQDIAGSDVSFTRLAHPETSDYQFLSRLAGEYGFERFSRAGVFHFREPQPDREPMLELEYGRSLRSFAPSADAGESDVGTVKVRHWDEKRKTEIVGTAEVTDGGSETRVHKTPVRSTAEAERRADAVARRLSKGPRSRGETLGIPDLEIGTVIDLDGLGDDHSGSYYVESANHRIDAGGYTTDFEVTEVIA